MKKAIFIISVIISIAIISYKIVSILTSVESNNINKIATTIYKNMKQQKYVTKINMNRVMTDKELQNLIDILSGMSWRDFELLVNYRVDITKHASAKFTVKVNSIDDDYRLGVETKRILDKARTYQSTRDKLAVINHEIIKMCEYDTISAQSLNRSDSNAWTAFGCLMEKRAVCEGYANAVTLLCEQLNIPVIRIYSDEMKGTHTWNSVYVDGEWLMLDVTWNDPTYIGDKPQRLTEDNYKYFLITPNKLKEYGYKYDEAIYNMTKYIKYPDMAPK